MNIMPSITLTQLEERINSIFHMAEICKWNHNELTDRLIEQVIQPLNQRTKSGRRRHSPYVEGYAAGIIAAQRSRIWREKVEFCFLVDGVLYSTWKNTTRRKTQEFYDRNEGHILANAPSSHYWLNSDKVY